MADSSVINESEQNYDLNGTTIFEKIIENFSQVATRFSAVFDFTLGPNDEHKTQYDNGDADPVENALAHRDANGNLVVVIPDTHKTIDQRRVPLVPEYDKISDIPEVRSGDNRHSLPYNPRGIVRFTKTAVSNESAIDKAGIYSYSKPNDKWVRLDRPP